MNRSRRSSDAGFTLIETLVTVVIVGITFVVFVGGMGASILTSTHHRKHAVGQANIRNFAESIKAAPYDPVCATAKASYATVAAASYADTSTPPRRTASGATFANVSSHTAPSLTPTGANTQLVAFYTLASGSSFAPPSDMAEQWDVASNGPTQAGQVTTSFNDQAWSATTATGTRIATSAASADSIAQAVSLQSATGGAGSIVRRGVASASTPGTTTMTLSKPTGTLAGDLMIAQIAVRGGTATTVSPPVGWHLVDERNNGLSIKSLIYQRTASDATASSYTWTFGSNPEAAGGIVSYGGVAMDYLATVDAVRFWDDTNLVFLPENSACPSSDGGLQLVKLTVVSRDAISKETVEVIKRQP